MPNQKRQLVVPAEFITAQVSDEDDVQSGPFGPRTMECMQLGGGGLVRIR